METFERIEIHDPEGHKSAYCETCKAQAVYLSPFEISKVFELTRNSIISLADAGQLHTRTNGGGMTICVDSVSKYLSEL